METSVSNLPESKVLLSDYKAVKQSRYDYLVARDKELSRLEANGVDNWEGYSLGLDEEEEDDDE